MPRCLMIVAALFLAGNALAQSHSTIDDTVLAYRINNDATESSLDVDEYPAMRQITIITKRCLRVMESAGDRLVLAVYPCRK